MSLLFVWFGLGFLVLVLVWVFCLVGFYFALFCF